MNQGAFCVALSNLMALKGKSRLKQSTLSGWELGNRQVPAGALVAAADLAGMSVDAIIGRAPRAQSAELAEHMAQLAEFIATKAPTTAKGKADERRVREIAEGIRTILKR
jgi:transcriptional regulator with XRE-family HTH domain